MTRAMKLADAMVVVPVDYFRLPLIAVVGAVFYAEPFDPMVFLGAGMIFAGVWAARRSAREVGTAGRRRNLPLTPSAPSSAENEMSRRPSWSVVCAAMRGPACGLVVPDLETVDGQEHWTTAKPRNLLGAPIPVSHCRDWRGRAARRCAFPSAHHGCGPAAAG